MSWPGPVYQNKDGSQIYEQVLLCVFTIPGLGSPLLLASHPFDGISGPTFPGIGSAVAGNYLGRIAQQDIEAIQLRSQLGIDRVSRLTVHIMDSDHLIYNSVAAAYGFRGAELQVFLVLWQAGTTTFSTDAPILFTGTCDMEVPQQGGNILSVAANTSHNTATIKMPLFPIQNRCPLVFPNTNALQQQTIFPNSTMCPYSASFLGHGGVGNLATAGGPANNGLNIVDQYGNNVTDGTGAYLMCDYTRSNQYQDQQGHTLLGGCMARLGNPSAPFGSSTGVAPDGDINHDTHGNHTGAFAGEQWNPGTYYEIDKQYQGGLKVATFSSINSSIWGTFQNLLYGIQWVNGKIANVIESGNDTKCEVMLCTGDIGDAGVMYIPAASGTTLSSISEVVVNGLQLNRVNTFPPGSGLNDNNLFWDFNQVTPGVYATGGRFGQSTNDTGYNLAGKYSALGDPYGSIAMIRTVFYNTVFTGSSGVPSIRVLCSGPRLWVYLPIANLIAGSPTSGTATVQLPFGTVNSAIGAAGEVVVIGNSGSGADGTYTANNATYGQTVTLTGMVSAGAFSITISNALGVVPSGYLQIESDGTNPAETVQVSSSYTTGTTVALAAALLYNHNNNSLVLIPGSVSFPSSAGSGTGGNIGAIVVANTYAGGAYSAQANSSPPWVLLDLLTKANWGLNEIDMSTFIAASAFSDEPVGYVNQVGAYANHPRFKCQFSLEQRKTAAEVIAGVLRCFNGYLAWSQSGLLQLYINQTLADSQPAQIPGSNYPNPVASFNASYKESWGSTATYTGGDTVTYSGQWYQSIWYTDDTNINQVPSSSPMYWQILGSGFQPVGYLAYSFDESSIARTSSSDLDIEFVDNATVMTPNQIVINFQDEDNQFIDDSANVIDTNAVTRSTNLQPGGAVIPETLNVIGLSNFDQVTRIANVYMAERQYGNELNIPIGTRSLKLGTTVRCEHLRVGHIVGLSLQMYNYVKQQFRVTGIAPTTDFQYCKLTLQWHNDTWYQDSYGQTPQAFYSFSGIQRPIRAPHPWQANAETPSVSATSPLFTANELSFQLAEIDGLQASGAPLITLQVSGEPPINTITSACQPPLVPIQAATSTSAGTIPAGHYLIQICGIDSNGYYSASTGVITANLTGTGQITINNIGWGTQTAGYDVFIGTDHYNITHQVSDTSHTPSSITISSLPNVLSYAPPDLAAGYIEVDAKLVIHGGIIGEVVVERNASPHTVTIGAPASGTLGSMHNRSLMLIGRPNLEANLPIITFNIISNVGSVLTVDRDPTSLLNIGDVVVICAQATSATSTTITDTGFVNAYSQMGLSASDQGYIVRIIYGTGRYQYRTITAVTGSPYLNSYTVSPPWTTTPDTTSVFIVEEASMRFKSTDAPINTSVYAGTSVGTIDVSNFANSALLVQPYIVDPTDTKFSNRFRSPVRMIWLSGLQGTTNVAFTTSSPTFLTYDQTIADGTILCDTSGVTGTTTTLSGLVSSGGTSIIVASAMGIVGGTYLTIVDGGSTETVLVASTYTSGTSIPLSGFLAYGHSGGQTIDIPGYGTVQLLQASQVPNQILIVRKTSADINYVIVEAGGTDTFPNGGNTIVLPNNAADTGSTTVKFPGQ